MKKIKLEVDSGVSEIFIGETIDKISHYIPDRRTIIITDKNVLQYYRSQIEQFDIIEIGNIYYCHLIQCLV